MEIYSVSSQYLYSVFVFPYYIGTTMYLNQPCYFPPPHVVKIKLTKNNWNSYQNIGQKVHVLFHYQS